MRTPIQNPHHALISRLSRLVFRVLSLIRLADGIGDWLAFSGMAALNVLHIVTRQHFLAYQGPAHRDAPVPAKHHP